MIEDTNDDNNITVEAQAAWNDAMFGPTPVTNPTFVMAIHDPGETWVIDAPVRFCADATPPAGSGTPDCDGAGLNNSITLLGDFRYECDMPEASVPPLQDRQVKVQRQGPSGIGVVGCLWVGNGAATTTTGPAVGGTLIVTSGVGFFDFLIALVDPHIVAPFFCDGCRQFGVALPNEDPHELRVVADVAPDVSLGGGYSSVLVGGSGDVTLEHDEDLLAVFGLVLAGPHDGTIVHGEVEQVTRLACVVDSLPYVCDTVLAEDLVVRNEVVSGGDGDLTSNATVYSRQNEPPFWLDLRETTAISDITIGGALISDDPFHACVRVSENPVDTTIEPASPIEVSALCINTSPGNDVGLVSCDHGFDGPQLDYWDVTGSRVLGLNAFNRHSISKLLNCQISHDSESLISVTTSGTLPSAPSATLSNDHIESATNGNLRTNALPTVTDDDGLPVGIQPGDRFRFTDGPFVNQGRVVVSVSGDTLMLSGPSLTLGGDLPLDDLDPTLLDVSPYEVVRPLCSDGGGNWVACMADGGGPVPGATKLFEVSGSGPPHMMGQGVVTLNAAVGSDVACELAWVKTSPGSPDILDQAGFEYYGDIGGHDPSWTVGADVRSDPADVEFNMYGPLLASGHTETRGLTQALEPGDYVELQLTPAPGNPCVDLVDCGCFDEDIGNVTATATVFPEDVVDIAFPVETCSPGATTLPTALTFLYRELGPCTSFNSQADDGCVGEPGTGPVSVSVVSEDVSASTATVSDGDTLTFAEDGNAALPDPLSVLIGGQLLVVSTACSATNPLNLGETFGTLILTGIEQVGGP